MSTRIKSIHQKAPADPLRTVRDEIRKMLIELERTAVPVQIDPTQGIDYQQAVADRERDLIEAALQITKGRQNKAAALLSLNPTTLYTKIQTLKIDPDHFKPKNCGRVE